MNKNTKIIFTILGIVSFVFYMWFNYTLPRTKYNIPVEKIYVINLDKSKDRLEGISKQFKAQNIAFTRFPAVSGLDLKIKDSDGNVFYGRDLASGKESFRIGESYKIYCPNVTLNYQWNPYLARGKGDHLSAGEFGVYCSNFEIMREIVKSGYKSVLILEDDIVIPKDFSKKLEILAQNMPNYKSYDIINLGYRGFSSKKWLDQKLKVKKIPFNPVLEEVTSYNINPIPYAVIVGFTGAKKILGIVKPNRELGLDISKLANEGQFNVFWARDIKLRFKDYGSEIEKMGREDIIVDPNVGIDNR